MQRQGIMLCYPYEEKRLAKWSRPFITQPKLDGDRCRAVPFEDHWKLFTSEGNEITSVPHILEQLNNIPRHSWMELDGEIYNHYLPHHEIHSIVSRTVNLHEDYEKAEFNVFDVVSETLPQIERFELLSHVIKVSHDALNTHIIPVETHAVENADDILNNYNHYISKGYEGIIIRNPTGPYKRKRSTDIMKFKPKKSDWYEIISYKEEVDKEGFLKGRLGAVICQGRDETEFSVGSGFTDSQRLELWNIRDALPGNFVRVEYQHIISGSQVPRFPIFLDIDEVSGE